MDDNSQIVIILMQFLIDISNILLNAFIIYALRKLDKLGNISFWFIFFLSISDCLVGLSGLACDVFLLCCTLGQDCSSSEYVLEVRSFFLAFSARLTTVIAIDRSIRMRYLNKYKNIMTKTKANTILIVNTMLSLVQFVGDLGPLSDIFGKAFDLLHFVCICSSCIFYLFTYCSLHQRVTTLDMNLRHSRNALTTGIQVRANDVANNVTKLKREDSNTPYGCNGGAESSCSPGSGRIPSNRGEGRYERNVIEEKTTAKSLRNNSDLKKLPVVSNGEEYGYGGDQEIILERNIPQHISSSTCHNSGEIRNRGRSENEAGKAILYIISALVIFYMPVLAVKFLFMWVTDSVEVIWRISILLLLVNSSVNAIVLIAFSREIRHLGVSFFNRSSDI